MDFKEKESWLQIQLFPRQNSIDIHLDSNEIQETFDG